MIRDRLMVAQAGEVEAQVVQVLEPQSMMKPVILVATPKFKTPSRVLIWAVPGGKVVQAKALATMLNGAEVAAQAEGATQTTLEKMVVGAYLVEVVAVLVATTQVQQPEDMVATGVVMTRAV